MARQTAVAFRDRLERNVNAQELGYRTLRSLRVGDYVWATSTYAGKTDWLRVHAIGDLEPARFGRGTVRRVTLESSSMGWDPTTGAARMTTKYETVTMFTTGESVRIRRPHMSAAFN